MGITDKYITSDVAKEIMPNKEEEDRVAAGLIGGGLLGAALGGPAGAVIGGIIGAALADGKNKEDRRR